VEDVWERQKGWKKGDLSHRRIREDIDVEDWQGELGGRQTEPMRSQVREESSEGGSVGGKDTDFEGVLSLARRI
jgi:hypothetical protein